MTFYKTTFDSAVEYLYQTISEKLKSGKKVLWLLTGGSGIKIEVEVSKRLNGQDLSNLSVILTDERFPLSGGDLVNHADSNWKQIIQAGFELKGANLMPILEGKDVQATTNDFEEKLSTLLDMDFKIGLFGMGADGHTAGILPGSAAASESFQLASFYETVDFIRVTMTFPAIEKLDEAVLCAFGEEKRPALENLQKMDLPIEQQPAQILKRLPKLTIFNDQIGEEKL